MFEGGGGGEGGSVKGERCRVVGEMARAVMLSEWRSMVEGDTQRWNTLGQNTAIVLMERGLWIRKS